MNKKILLTVTAMFFVAFGIMAQSRSAAEAMSVANSFLTKKDGTSLRAAEQLSLAYTAQSKLRGTTENAYFYVFNRGDNNGFIIVSADERAKDILGYSDAGTFNADNLPENFRSWLTVYESEIESLNNPALQSTTAPETVEPILKATAIKPSVAPLALTKWDQGDPYDIHTPVGPIAKTPTGCAATAMAQIMKYHNHPAKGTGSHSYTSETLKFALSADFNTTYDWANMTNTYDANSTEAQRNAVAKLMYHCGISINMDYNSEDGGSAAIPTDVVIALVKYFDYDKTIQFQKRNNYSYAAWTNLLKLELSESRPVFYGGQGSGGGHAFVCSGYDTNDKFHINWGWGGQSDGYYELSALNPSSLGIGGGAGGYNLDQNMITGIRPNVGGIFVPSMFYNSVTTTKTALASLNEELDIKISRFLYSGHSLFRGTIGFSICKTDNSIISYIPLDGDDIPAFTGYEYLNVKTKLPDISAGTYRLIPAYHASISSDHGTLMQVAEGGIRYIEITVNANKSVTVKQAAPAKPNLARNSFATVAPLSKNSTGGFTANITNSGAADYRSRLRVEFQGQSLFLEEPVVIPAGATKDVGFSGTIAIAPGTYTVNLLYDKNDSIIVESSDFAPLGAAIQVTVADVAALELVSGPAASHLSAVDKSKPEIAVEIKNTGGRFEGKISAVLVNDESLILAKSETLVVLEQGQTKEVKFNDPFAIDPGNYLLLICYTDSEGDLTPISPAYPITITASSSTDKASAEQPTVSYTAAGLQITAAATVRTVQIYNLVGALQTDVRPNAAGTINIPLSNLAPSAYIVRIGTDKGVTTAKFVKRN